jgi:hypothetical protein
VKTLEQIANEFASFCKQLGARNQLKTTPRDDGSAHVEISAGRYHYVATERGSIREHRVTDDDDELLYWLMKDVTFELAMAYELRHRVQGQSFRRLLFSTQIELLQKVKPEWAEKKRVEIESILRVSPYDDAAEG